MMVNYSLEMELTIMMSGQEGGGWNSVSTMLGVLCVVHPSVFLMHKWPVTNLLGFKEKVCR